MEIVGEMVIIGMLLSVAVMVGVSDKFEVIYAVRLLRTNHSNKWR